MYALASRSICLLLSAGLLFASGSASASSVGGPAASSRFEREWANQSRYGQTPGRSFRSPGRYLPPPVTGNTARNPALTGGTDPAIGQPSPRLPDAFGQ